MRKVLSLTLIFSDTVNSPLTQVNMQQAIVTNLQLLIRRGEVGLHIFTNFTPRHQHYFKTAENIFIRSLCTKWTAVIVSFHVFLFRITGKNVFLEQPVLLNLMMVHKWNGASGQVSSAKLFSHAHKQRHTGP